MRGNPGDLCLSTVIYHRDTRLVSSLSIRHFIDLHNSPIIHIQKKKKRKKEKKGEEWEYEKVLYKQCF